MRYRSKSKDGRGRTLHVHLCRQSSHKQNQIMREQNTAYLSSNQLHSQNSTGTSRRFKSPCRLSRDDHYARSSNLNRNASGQAQDRRTPLRIASFSPSPSFTDKEELCDPCDALNEMTEEEILVIMKDNPELCKKMKNLVQTREKELRIKSRPPRSPTSKSKWITSFSRSYQKVLFYCMLRFNSR